MGLTGKQYSPSQAQECVISDLSPTTLGEILPYHSVSLSSLRRPLVLLFSPSRILAPTHTRARAHARPSARWLVSLTVCFCHSFCLTPPLIGIFRRVSIFRAGAEKSKLGKKKARNRCCSRQQSDFPFSSLSVLVKYNNISLVQTSLMVPANMMKPQTPKSRGFFFVVVLFSPHISHRACQLGPFP